MRTLNSLADGCVNPAGPTTPENHAIPILSRGNTHRGKGLSAIRGRGTVPSHRAHTSPTANHGAYEIGQICRLIHGLKPAPNGAPGSPATAPPSHDPHASSGSHGQASEPTTKTLTATARPPRPSARYNGNTR
ncbi:hypothetical protein GCM10027157_07760 [Corynebacterium aquatimens]